MKKSAPIRLSVFKFFRQVGAQPRDAVQAATALSFEVAQVRPVLRWLCAHQKLILVGGDACHGYLYQFCAGATPPNDARGKSRHLSGVAWTTKRKRRANMARARAAKRRLDKTARSRRAADAPDAPLAELDFARWPLITKAIV